jgi:uncharacterized protein (TIGR02246 family)
MAKASFDEVVRILYDRLLEAWNKRDAAAMAALFGEFGDMVGFDGSMASGRAEIEAHLKPIFADHPTATFIARVRGVRLLGRDVALLRAVAGMVPPGKADIDPNLNAIQSLIVGRSGDRWQVELFHNTPAAFHGRSEERKRLIEELRSLLPGRSAHRTVSAILPSESS